MSHTPTPWKIIDDHEIVGANDWLVADVTKTDAVLIVKCVNGFDELVAALDGVMELVNTAKLVRNITDDAEPDWALRQLPFVAALTTAQRVLDKAKGIT